MGKHREIENDETGLIDKHKRFCENYYKDFNGTRAYKEVFGVKKDSTARTNASRLLAKANVIAYLESLKTKLAELSGISPLMVLNEHKKIAFSSMANIYTAWTTRRELEELTDDEKACIQEIDTKVKIEYQYSEELEKKVPVNVEYIRIKLFDKKGSLDAINKMLGYNAPDEIDVKSGGEKLTTNMTDEEIDRRINKIINSGKES